MPALLQYGHLESRGACTLGRHRRQHRLHASRLDRHRRSFRDRSGTTAVTLGTVQSSRGEVADPDGDLARRVTTMP